MLDDWSINPGTKYVVISPDVDGLTSAAILNSIYPLKIIGIYSTTHLLLLDDHTPEDAKNALWLDHDISQIGVRCVGQHVVHHEPTDNLPLREPTSWNPNVWQKQSWNKSFSGVSGRTLDKYPYGTAHFLWDLDHRNIVPTPVQTAILAHADGTWFALDCYKANGILWKNLMFSNSQWIDKLLNYRQEVTSHALHAQLAADLALLGFSSQSRSPRARTLPTNLQALTGRQSLGIRMTTNSTRYLNQITLGLQLIGGHMNSTPAIGTRTNPIISGQRLTQYPNRITNFDQVMVAETIFSHAFTDLRTLSYTVQLQL